MTINPFGNRRDNRITHRSISPDCERFVQRKKVEEGAERVEHLLHLFVESERKHDLVTIIILVVQIVRYTIPVCLDTRYDFHHSTEHIIAFTFMWSGAPRYSRLRDMVVGLSSVLEESNLYTLHGASTITKA